MEKRERRILEKIKVNQEIFSSFDFPESEKKAAQKLLIDEWIKYHSLKEFFKPSFYKPLETNFFGISKKDLLKEGLKQKINKRWKK